MHRSALSLAALLVVTGALAQQSPSSPAAPPENPAQEAHSFVVVEHSSMRVAQGAWNSSTPLFRYVKEHPGGDYVVFAENGSLYRLDNPQQLTEVQRLYAPMKGLSAQQEAYGRAQAPLSQAQVQLSHQQANTTDPAEKGRLGQAQGELGRQQGDLGSLQGALGHQQGEIARAAYRQMQVLFARCLADGSCHRVAS